MIILGIETSCDETAVSILDVKEHEGKREFKVLNNAVLSQIKLHEQYGGVFPMMAKREHAKNLVPLLSKVLEETNLKGSTGSATKEKISKITELLNQKEKELLESLLADTTLHQKPAVDAIAVTIGPGLEPALWVGVNFARALSLLWNIPAIPVNHMEGHIVASLLKPESNEDHLELRSLPFPSLALLISGGHTELVEIKDHGAYKILGRTRDDAVGEAFDKAARLLGLPYPGGPAISKLAAKERLKSPAPQKNYILPRPMINSKDFDFSFSGIKTAVLYMTQEITKEKGENRISGNSETISSKLSDDVKEQIAREFEDAVTEVLIEKTKRALEQTAAQALIIGGGVIANTFIRKEFEQLAAQMNIPLLLPETKLSTDNALMIALAGALMLQGELPAIEDSFVKLKAEGNLSL